MHKKNINREIRMLGNIRDNKLQTGKLNLISLIFLSGKNVLMQQINKDLYRTSKDHSST
jgi:hypothetical protein